MQSVRTSLAGWVLCQRNNRPYPVPSHSAVLCGPQIVALPLAHILQAHIYVKNDLLGFIHKTTHAELLQCVLHCAIYFKIFSVILCSQ